MQLYHVTVEYNGNEVSNSSTFSCPALLEISDSKNMRIYSLEEKSYSDEEEKLQKRDLLYSWNLNESFRRCFIMKGSHLSIFVHGALVAISPVAGKTYLIPERDDSSGKVIVDWDEICRIVKEKLNEIRHSKPSTVQKMKPRTPTDATTNAPSASTIKATNTIIKTKTLLSSSPRAILSKKIKIDGDDLRKKLFSPSSSSKPLGSNLNENLYGKDLKNSLFNTIPKSLSVVKSHTFSKTPATSPSNQSTIQHRPLNPQRYPSHGHWHHSTSSSNNNFSMMESNRGFINLGNTCYMNSALVCLFHLKYFASIIMERGKVEGCRKVEYLLYKLLSAFRSKSSISLNASALKNYYGSINEAFATHQQQDAQEFLSLMLDDLTGGIGISFGDSTLNTSSFLDYRSCFRLELDQRVVCKTCFSMSRSNQFCHEISLGIGQDNEKIVDLEYLIRKNFEDELINDYDCEKCNPKFDDVGVVERKASIQKLLKKVPKVLVFQLKRFAFDPNTGTLRKNSRPVFFPPTLSMDIYMKRGWQVSDLMAKLVNGRDKIDCSTIEIDNKENHIIDLTSSNHRQSEPSLSSPSSDKAHQQQPKQEYKLSGVIKHVVSNSLEYGHYVSDVADERISDRWITFDDSRQRILDHAEVADFYSDITRQRSAYILFYEKIS